MKNIKLLSLVLLFLGAYSCKQAKKEAKDTMENVEAMAEEIKEERHRKYECQFVRTYPRGARDSYS